ncbi:MAG: MobC family plasmid mobilization relaxosome protein [Lachnospiraceae bacterium]|nr:MobC family plasmid mobilization relaxosome protein [Lachnospiraceae bacterium]
MGKEIVKHFRLTIEAAEAFSKLAEQEGMKESDYFRLLITQKPNDYPELRSGLKSLINEVNRIGVNINEIVYNNNSHLYRVQDKNRLIAYMRRLNETVERAVEDFGYHENTDHQ